MSSVWVRAALGDGEGDVAGAENTVMCYDQLDVCIY